MAHVVRGAALLAPGSQAVRLTIVAAEALPLRLHGVRKRLGQRRAPDGSDV